MSYDTVLELPLRVFTLYNNSINRIKAENELREIRVLSTVEGGDVKELFTRLLDEMGETVITEGEEYVAPEAGALDRLQGLASLR